MRGLFWIALLFVLLLLSAIYYFFGMRIAVVNQVRNAPISFRCSANTGKTWDFGRIGSGGTRSKLLFLASGSAVICEAAVDGKESASSVVLGYFHEENGNISVFLDDSPDGIFMNVYEHLDDGKQQIDSKQLRPL